VDCFVDTGSVAERSVMILGNGQASHETGSNDCQESRKDFDELIPDAELSPVPEETAYDEVCSLAEEKKSFPSDIDAETTVLQDSTSEVIVWHGSAAAQSFGCRGWTRGDDEWEKRTEKVNARVRDTLTRCKDDAKFRTRLCNHWDTSFGTECPMRRKNKCIFAHGPVELRVKEGKRSRWGKLVDASGNASNANHSGGEDTYGAARAIETERKHEGKWNTSSKSGKVGDKKAKSAVRNRKPQPLPVTS
jgi:hypothetical protein